MKTVLLSACVLLSGGALAGEINVDVKGMVCSMCAQGIQKKFSSLPEVKDLSVDLATKKVVIHTHEGKDVSDAVVTKLITDSGYAVSGIKRK